MRFGRVIRNFQTISEMFHFNYDSVVAALKIIAFAIVLLMWCHISACLQFLIPTILPSFPDRDSWIVLRGLHYDSNDLFLQYRPGYYTIDAVFRTGPLLYHTFENMVFFRPGNLYSLCSPGNQHYHKIIYFLIFHQKGRNRPSKFDNQKYISLIISRFINKYN